MAWENEEVVKGFFLFKKNKNSNSGKDIKAWKIFNLMRMVRIRNTSSGCAVVFYTYVFTDSSK